MNKLLSLIIIFTLSIFFLGCKKNTPQEEKVDGNDIIDTNINDKNDTSLVLKINNQIYEVYWFDSDTYKSCIAVVYIC